MQPTVHFLKEYKFCCTTNDIDRLPYYLCSYQVSASQSYVNMEGIAALSLACNVLQVADLTRSTVRTAREIRSLVDGTRKMTEAPRDVAARLQNDIAELQSERYKALKDRSCLCQAAVETHLALPDSLRLNGACSSFSAVRVAIIAR